jgi:prepilin peptidase CpaA
MYSFDVAPIPFAFAVLLSGMMLAVLWKDTREYRIPNTLNSSIFLLWLPALFLLNVSLIGGLLGFGLVLAVGLGLFALRLMGGGDIKLLAVLALWMGGWQGTLSLLLATVLLGGVLAILLVILRRIVAPMPKLPRVLTKGAPIPYGVAIAGAFLWLLWRGQVFGLG